MENIVRISQPAAARSQRILLNVDWRIYLAVLIPVISWASAFAGIRAGLESYTPEHLALLRYIIASFALAVYAVLTRMPLPRLRDVPGIALAGFIGVAFYSITLNAGEIGVSAGVASMIVASSPIFVALLARMIHKEHLSRWGWGGILTSFSGVAVIALGNGGLQFDARALLVLAAAVAQSLYIIGQKPFLKRYSALQFTAYAIWSATIFLLPFGGGLLTAVQQATPDATLAIVYMGIVPGAIGYASWAYVVGRMAASKAASFLYLVPAFAIAIAWLWLGEAPTTLAVLGGGLVLLGVVIVNRRGKIQA